MGRSEVELPGVEASWWSSGVSNRDLGKITVCNRGKWCSERRRQIHLTPSSSSPLGVPFLFYFFFNFSNHTKRCFLYVFRSLVDINSVLDSLVWVILVKMSFGKHSTRAHLLKWQTGSVLKSQGSQYGYGSNSSLSRTFLFFLGPISHSFPQILRAPLIIWSWITFVPSVPYPLFMSPWALSRSLSIPSFLPLFCSLLCLWMLGSYKWRL